MDSHTFGWENLWHGRNLAFTVAWLTVILALLFCFASTRWAPDLDPTPQGCIRS